MKLGRLQELTGHPSVVMHGGRQETRCSTLTHLHSNVPREEEEGDEENKEEEETMEKGRKKEEEKERR
ncbi:hypothetical protein Pmani_027624 [Petrolisthes manimaculis]|uniref:Uncharacterized protein n=1 Tax=Petrolisthes manimaculis TaxID=1843537 RepID=A0AAE1P358_9EUCA|nr:hypothetical protein Pmani_027624 [Petrolisthes manimaculis]